MNQGANVPRANKQSDPQNSEIAAGRIVSQKKVEQTYFRVPNHIALIRVPLVTAPKRATFKSISDELFFLKRKNFRISWIATHKGFPNVESMQTSSFHIQADHHYWAQVTIF